MTDLKSELEKALKQVNTDAISKYHVCDPCIGRRFAIIARGHRNEERGRIVREVLGVEKTKRDDCWVCDGLLGEIEEMSNVMIAELKPYEFSNLLIGSRIDPEVELREEELTTSLGKEMGEPIKGELNRRIGKIVTDHFSVDVEFDKPDIVGIIDTRFFSVDVESNPVFIFGRYRKLERGIPQTRWPCRECRGKGCDRCNGTGMMYQTSVEELIGKVALVAYEAEDHRFHGMGREDVDALMLGNGRPFVLELKEPKKRFIELEKLEKAANEQSAGKAEYELMEYADKEKVRMIKGAKADKVYGVTVKIHGGTTESELENSVKGLVGTIHQRTPIRVAHRRADKVRVREVKSIHVERLNGEEARLVIEAETGTYIKEMLHGDQGRTTPSLSDMLDKKVEVEALDVVQVKYP